MSEYWPEGRTAVIKLRYDGQDEIKFFLGTEGEVTAKYNSSDYGFEGFSKFNISEVQEEVLDPILDYAEDGIVDGGNATKPESKVEIIYEFKPGWWDPDTHRLHANWDEFTVRNYEEVLKSLGAVVEAMPDINHSNPEDVATQILDEDQIELRNIIKDSLEAVK